MILIRRVLVYDCNDTEHKARARPHYCWFVDRSRRVIGASDVPNQKIQTEYSGAFGKLMRLHYHLQHSCLSTTRPPIFTLLRAPRRCTQNGSDSSPRLAPRSRGMLDAVVADRRRCASCKCSCVSRIALRSCAGCLARCRPTVLACVIQCSRTLHGTRAQAVLDMAAPVSAEVVALVAGQRDAIVSPAS